MSTYERILEIAQSQAKAAASGDLNTAVQLLEKRGQLIASAPAASTSDEPTIRAILELDRDIATAFRRQMIAIRDEALGLQRGQHALSGYRTPSGHPPRVFDLSA